jgi:uncharacterized protein (TIGR02679 family)
MTDTGGLVRELYGDEALRPLFDAARRRLEERDLAVGGIVTLRDSSERERLAIGRLLGADRLHEGDLRVRLMDLDDALRRQATGLGLLEVISALSGPLAARRAERNRTRALRASIFDVATGHPALVHHPILVEWLAWLRARGTLSRLDADLAESLLKQALDVLAALPVEGISLPVLAGRVTGSTHALDRGSVLAPLVDRGVAAIAGADPTKASRRDLWARCGVSLDAISSTVTVLNLRPAAGPLRPILTSAADLGEPLPVTLRMLRDLERLDLGGVIVSLCENRSIIEAVADELGACSAPLVCLSGEPTAAGRRLVGLLAAGGAGLRYHGDFDFEGIAIANSVIGSDVVPWRFGTGDYLAALATTPVRDELNDSTTRAHWDAGLTETMRMERARIYEEHVLTDLIADLDRGSGM